MLTVLFALLFYAATAFLLGGLAYKIVQYAKTPAPLKIPTMPAPLSRQGVALRMAREIVLFESLFNSNKWTWLFSWMFHLALVLVLLRHLRYFTEPVWGWVALLQTVGLYAGFAMVAGLAGLWLRRVAVERFRYVSGPSDHLMLLLLSGIAVSGLAMPYVVRADIVALKAFVLGVMYFDWQPLPADPILLIHLGLVAVLMVVFPFSKLLHAPAVFFSPSRNQVDDAREKRHLAPWAAKLESASD
jgi:nitrate reductase gamma subunit